jgi:Zn-dependent peptidase ImmA (M78 family)/DNA-binding XRE family transcriptional regulator
MRIGNNNFQPKRLIQAREVRGLTQTELAEKIGKSSSTISKWESGSQFPEPNILNDLSKELDLPVNFFTKELKVEEKNQLFFRTMASTTVPLRKKVYHKLTWTREISFELQSWIDFPKINIPKLDTSKYDEIINKDIEQIANECRRVWGLGLAPVKDVLLVLENAGVLIVKEELGSSLMDGLCDWFDEDQRPYMLLAKDKDSCTRSRFDAAHELGHLVLHHSIDKSALKKPEAFRAIENQAHYFAGAFLLPAESFSSDIWNPSLTNFSSIKEKWKVSIGAMIKRAYNLDIISKDYETQLWKNYSARGWRKGEPLDDTLIPENPQLIANSIKLLVDEKVQSKSELMNLFCLNDKDVESICGLERGYMTLNGENIIPIQARLKSHASNSYKEPEKSSIKIQENNIITFSKK